MGVNCGAPVELRRLIVAQPLQCGKSAKLLHERTPERYAPRIDTGFRLTHDDVKSSIDLIKLGKAPGPSGITGKFLQVFSREVVPVFTAEFNRWLSGEKPSKWWKRSWIRMIPKRGDLAKVANWRGICLLNEEWKVFSRAMKLKLEPLIVLHPSQIGFVKRRWIQEHILVVQAGLQSETVKGGWILLDFKNAYPSLRWEWLEKEMYRRGGEQWVSLTRLLVGGEARVSVGDKMGAWFPMLRGVKQGDVIAPLLFNIGLDPILRAIDELHVGVNIEGVTVSSLAFADDLTQGVENEEQVQLVTDLLTNVEAISGLVVNDSKTVVLWNHSTTPPDNIPWTVVHKARVLGVMVSSAGEAVWSEEWENFKRRIEILSTTRAGWGSLLERARKVNAYACSVLTHTLRVDIEVYDILEEYEVLVRKVLRTRMKWSRLVAPVSCGGYGVIDLLRLSRALKLSWLSYISDGEERGVFEAVLRAWVSRTKFNAGTVVGPLLSWNSLSGETMVWRNLCNAWERVEKWIEWSAPVRVWTSEDRDGGSLSAVWDESSLCFDDGEMLHRACDVAGDGDEVLLLRDRLRKFVLDGTQVSVLPGLQERRKWMHILKPGAAKNTCSQERWKALGFDWREQWKATCRKKIPDRVKWWVLDALNNALRVVYHSQSVPCRLCGQPVGGRHFTGGCSFTNVLKAYISRSGDDFEEEEIWWLVWKAHCCRTGVSCAALVQQLKRLRALLV